MRREYKKRDVSKRPFFNADSRNQDHQNEEEYDD